MKHPVFLSIYAYLTQMRFPSCLPSTRLNDFKAGYGAVGFGSTAKFIPAYSKKAYGGVEV